MQRKSGRDRLGNVQYDILCDGVWYRTVRLISDINAEALRGRGTRVWEVNEIIADDIVDPTPRVLKDSWVDASRRREGDILQMVREDASNIEEKHKHFKFEDYFMQVKAYGDVLIDGAVDDTHALIRRGRSLEGMAAKPLITRPPILVTRRRAKCASSNPAQKLVERDAKIHHRIVFAEVGVTVTEVGTLSGALSALADAMKGENSSIRLTNVIQYRLRSFPSAQVRLGPSRY